MRWVPTANSAAARHFVSWVRTKEGISGAGASMARKRAYFLSETVGGATKDLRSKGNLDYANGTFFGGFGILSPRWFWGEDVWRVCCGAPFATTIRCSLRERVVRGASGGAAYGVECSLGSKQKTEGEE